MGLLADAFSYGDSLKRKVGGLLADPMGTIELGINRIKEDNNNALNLFANAYPMTGDRTVLNSPAQKAAMQKQLADYASTVGMAGATVWHGSPHKFDKFDSSKIGTGEGAQAYGHGLYLAESPDVAREYQTKLSSTGGAKNLASKYGDVDGGIAEATRRIEHYKQMIADGGGGDLRRANSMLNIAQKNLDDLTAMKAGLPENTGALYKVDLPDEHIAKMLDWDKPLSQQPKEVQQPLRDMWLKAKKSFAGIDPKADPAASQVHHLYQQHRGGNSVAVADELRQAGIPGIRYLDGGSRGTGQGTSNFVVFPGNEGLLSILERNGKKLGGN